MSQRSTHPENQSADGARRWRVSATREVLVVIGAGSVGQAIARRQGSGKAVLLADFSERRLQAAAEQLMADGHRVAAHVVDVSSRESLAALAIRAAGLGSRVTQVVHTAGLSSTQESPAAILRIDLLGVALMLEELGAIMAAGGAGVVISSMPGSMSPPLTREQEQTLARTPADELLRLPFLSTEQVADSRIAYEIAKRANQIHVLRASLAWGRRGARVNSISPGITSTPMSQRELAAESGAFLRAMIDASGAGRLGTPEDIAAAAAFLLGPDSTFITGTDLLVDGGAMAAVRSGHFRDPRLIDLLAALGQE